MARKSKVLLPANISREEAETAFADYAGADAQIQKITGMMDVKITKIREEWQEKLASLNEQKTAAFEIVQTYAVNNRDDFGKKKSLEFAHGVIGFRTGTPKLKTRKGFTWEAVKSLVKNALPSYIRTTEEVDKAMFLANRNEPEIAQQLPNLGIMVDQDETFFVEPKKEEVANA